MIRFVHTADVHFGMENYGRIDRLTGIHSRLLDFARAFDECIERALDEKVDFFLFSGDAYKTAHPSQTHQKLLFERLLRLYKAHIPVVIIVGNHDHPLSFGKTHALDLFDALPFDGFHVIAQPRIVQLTTKSGPVNVVGIPWPTRSTVTLQQDLLPNSNADITAYISEAVGIIIKKLAAQLDPTIPAVLGAHLTVASGVFSGSEKRAIYGTDPLFMPSDLAIKPFDYVGLGHLHRYQDLNPHGYPSVVYSGSIERIDFGERLEQKGFCLVTIHEKNKTEHQFIPVTTRPFIQIDITLINETSHTEQIIQEVLKHPIQDAIIKIVYRLPTDTIDTVDLKRISRACAAAFDIASIIPVMNYHKKSTRVRGATIDMDIETLLTDYLNSKPEWEQRKHELKREALALFEEAKNEKNDCL